MKRNRILAIVIAVVAVALVVTTTLILVFNVNKKVTTGSVAVERDLKFNAAYAKVSNDDLRADGFAFGDSCDLYFSNGKKLEDIPYYDGYYVPRNDVLLCGYPGYTYVAIAKNLGNFWEDVLNNDTQLLSAPQFQEQLQKSAAFLNELGLTDNTTVEIVLREKGKYLVEENAYSLHYSDERKDYPTDVKFANFREVTVGNIKSGRLYRGASPFDTVHNRPAYVDKLLQENDIHFILDLADSQANMDKYLEDETIANGYAAQQETVLLSMSADYSSQYYREQLAYGLRVMTGSEGAYYVHCTEGKDRTGFVCFILEGLCGASYEELKKDYMVTYYNYYDISEADGRYNLVVDLWFNDFCKFLTDSTEVENKDYREASRKYLLDSGMSDEEIDALVDVLTK